MTLTVLTEVAKPYETSEIMILEKIIYTTLYYSGFFSRYVLLNEFKDKRQKCELTDKIAKIITDNFEGRVDPDRDDTYAYCLRDITDTDLGRIMIAVAQKYFNSSIFVDGLLLRLQLRKLLFETDGRLSRRVDEFFPLFAKPQVA